VSYSPRLIFLTVLAMLVLVAPAATQQGTLPPGPPDPVALSGGWQIRFDPSDRGRGQNWKSGNWNERWSSVSVPHVFNAKPVDSQFLGTVGWYRMRLKTPATPAGFHWALKFEGARREATVWLNGRRIGENSNPFEPFTVRAAGLKPPGQTNSLVVRVSNERSKELREGWWNWGGLTRPVELEPVGAVDWDDVGILSDVECANQAKGCTAIARTDGVLTNHTDRTVSPRLQVTLTSPTGTVSTKTVVVKDLKPFQRRRIGFPVGIQGKPALWSPLRPNLYSSSVSVTLDDTVTQREVRQVGLRFVRVTGGQLYLNGHKLQLRGASIQEDVPGRGAALRDQDIETTVSDLKRLGANVTRAQYPLNERLLERMDQEGILVWSQSPVYHDDVELQTAAGRAAALDKVRLTVLYARNHPSVLAHSVANELSPYADSMPGTRRFLTRAARVARDLDDTVPAALDLLSYPNIPRQRVYANFGLLGINSYYGWYEGKDGAQSTADFDSLAPFLRDMRRMYPRQAQIITEFGAEATFDGPASEKETFAFQARYVDRTLQVVEDLPWLAGAIYWTAREFYVKPRWDGGALRRDVVRDSLHNKGLIRYDGRPKPAFYAARKDFRSTPVYAP